MRVMAGDGGIGRPGQLERHAGFALAKDEAGIAHGRNETERFGRMARMGRTGRTGRMDRLGPIGKIGKREAIAIEQAGGSASTSVRPADKFPPFKHFVGSPRLWPSGG